jgi:hypothetical protein
MTRTWILYRHDTPTREAFSGSQGSATGYFCGLLGLCTLVDPSDAYPGSYELEARLALTELGYSVREAL